MHPYRKFCLFLILFSILQKSEAQVNLNNGLVSWLPFSGTMNDASGNANNGVPQGTTYTTDRFGAAGQAVFLNGINEFITLNDAMGQFSSTPFSIVLWIQPSAEKYSCLIGKRNFGPTNSQQYQLSLFRPAFGLFSGITSNALPCPGDLTLDVMNVTNYPSEFCINTWHNIIITFDGRFQRMYFDGVLVDETPSSFPAMQQCNADIRLGNWWSGDPLSYFGKMDDFRWYNRVINSDEILALAGDKGPDLVNTADFIQERSACSPSNITFTNVSPNLNTNVLWRFGDGNISRTSNSITHTYQAPGLYPVTLIINENDACSDAVTKLIDMSLTPADVIVTPDTIVCVDDSFRLRAIPAQMYCWSPAILQSTKPNDPSGSLTIQSSQNLDLVVVPDAFNIVRNGDFELGNQDFTSEYGFTAQRSGDAQFGIVTNPRNWFSAVVCSTCVDHTGANGGRLLVVNGSTDTTLNLWCQTISVAPNRSYTFSFWVNKYATPDLATVGLYIDNIKMISVDDGNNNPGIWQQYSFDWNSGSKQSINFCIRLTGNSATGNLLGIDDISIKEKVFRQESIRISVAGGPPLQVSPDTMVCQGQSVQLSVTGGFNNSWSPSMGLSDPNSATPLARPNVTTKYYVVSDAGACSSEDSVLVVVNPNPVLVAPADRGVCEGDSVQLVIAGAITYEWFPAAGLDDPLSSTPIAFPSATTNYLVKGTDDNGCADTAGVKVTVFPKSGLFIPNAFTPNNDGRNDCFRIPNSGGSGSFELAIFDRYGERVFYTRDPAVCWDGRFKNQDLPIGSYTYYLNMATSCEVIRRKGLVSIIR